MKPETPTKVPLTLYGQIVGSALVGPKGQIFIDIDETDQGKELKELLQRGWVDHVSLVPQNHYIPKALNGELRQM